MNKQDQAAANEYCDKPSCANITRNDKTWRRMNAAFLACIANEQARAEKLLKALEWIASNSHGDIKLVASNGLSEYRANEVTE